MLEESFGGRTTEASQGGGAITKFNLPNVDKAPPA